MLSRGCRMGRYAHHVRTATLNTGGRGRGGMLSCSPCELFISVIYVLAGVRHLSPSYPRLVLWAFISHEPELKTEVVWLFASNRYTFEFAVRRREPECKTEVVWWFALNRDISDYAVLWRACDLPVCSHSTIRAPIGSRVAPRAAPPAENV